MSDTPDVIPIRRALLSVSDKTGLVEFARVLDRRGIQIVSTGGTARTLEEAGLTVTAVEALTGVAEMMGGRVKTLHPAVHGAVLARRDLDEDLDAMREHGITPIDLVCVNLYPFEQTISQAGTTPAQAIEQIDIGGPAMVRSAAKNHAFVAIVTSPDQYQQLAAELDAHDGATTMAFRRRLAAAAFRLTASYDGHISHWMDTAAPPQQRELRYGENPHQAAWLHALAPASDGGDDPAIPTARVLHGKTLSYNNIQDAAAALLLVQDLHRVAIGKACAAIIKHTNACGAAIADSLAEAFDLACEGDPIAAYGGILAVNRVVGPDTADRICDGQRFLEVIVAPGYDDAALAKLSARWKNVRLLAVGDFSAAVVPTETESRSIPGGVLVQERDTAIARPQNWKHAAGPEPKGRTLDDAVFAWTVVKHLRSNAVAIAAAGRLLGGGCGLVDRVWACRLALEKAGTKLARHESIVAASDAFFPFADGPKLLIEAGVTCIVHPGGSKRDQETIDACNKSGVTCLVTGIRHFKH
ncbi:MAG: bifunctional phosphoribosylaminoimidazolecarboxamide formyltransferase/IMP cyclohydrolase [Phycisphaerales bacterium]